MKLNTKPVKLIYLHGFNSSPDSHKAMLLEAYMLQQGLLSQLEIPAISPYPDVALSTLKAAVDQAQTHYEVALAGSSLGGFYATVLAELYGLKAVLVNPAVRPHALLQKYIGGNTNYYTNQHWVLNAEHIVQLHDMDVEPVTQPERYMLMLQTGDETLDYRDAEAKYAGSYSLIEEGGSHSFDNFECHIPAMLNFCGILDEQK